MQPMNAHMITVYKVLVKGGAGVVKDLVRRRGWCCKELGKKEGLV